MSILIQLLLVTFIHSLTAIDQSKMARLLDTHNHEALPAEIDLHTGNPQLDHILSTLRARLNPVQPSRRRRIQASRTTTPPPTTTQASDSAKEGQLRLVGGRTHFEGNVQIMHNGHWGAVCDDEWDLADADVVCRQIGFVLGALEATGNGRYGQIEQRIWMDNVFCKSNEPSLDRCLFDGWAQHDCQLNEAAGVVCRTQPNQQIASNARREEEPRSRNSIHLDASSIWDESVEEEKPRLDSLFGGQIETRLVHSNPAVNNGGRVEVQLDGAWNLVCGDGFGMTEAAVVCRQLGFDGVQSVQHESIGLHDHSRGMHILSGMLCQGSEQRLAECSMSRSSSDYCPDSHDNIAGVMCSAGGLLPDLMPDAAALESSAFLEDRPLAYLQCALEESCLSRSAYELDRHDSSWMSQTRRLLRFTARIKNVGRVSFLPAASKHEWIWHSCHRHYHSMETFAQFDILNPHTGRRVAEGHKASFCLEDNECDHPAGHQFACAHFGDQGISVGCVDTYKSDLDCQWIDITDVPYGDYQLRLAVNPEEKVAELSYDNNDVVCRFFYTRRGASVTNCTLASGPRASRHF